MIDHRVTKNKVVVATADALAASRDGLTERYVMDRYRPGSDVVLAGDTEPTQAVVEYLEEHGISVAGVHRRRAGSTISTRSDPRQQTLDCYIGNSDRLVNGLPALPAPG